MIFKWYLNDKFRINMNSFRAKNKLRSVKCNK